MNRGNDRRLVYSTDPKDKVVARKGKDGDQKNKVNQTVDLEKLQVIFRLEKNGWGGKTVTILSALPKNDQFLSDFTKELKTKCGTGGTYKILDAFGEIEIQGDKRDQIKKILTARGIKFRGM
ncbi:MAG: translation initiation factor [Bdellovibrionaceae bacterium]|nr:translation initiation factor [Pseudobdellovibrionaceae bacterium]